MRHFLAKALPVTSLSIRVSPPAFVAGLVAPAGVQAARPPGRNRARRAAVTMAPVAVTAELEDPPARCTRAGHEPQRFQAPPARTRGSRPAASGVRSPDRW
jgi:hypothetical protein